MPRKLLALALAVKQRALLGSLLAGPVVWAAFACGGPPPKARPADPYGARVASCIDESRVENDAAQARMLRVPAGPAVLGSTEAERAQARRDFGPGGEPLFADEAKVRRAYVHGFQMDRSPVTAELYAEFAACCGIVPPDAETLPAERWAAQQQRFGSTHPYAEIQRFLWTEHGPPAGRERHPMVLVTQDEAGLYCAWRGARLPTAEEWERAARGVNGNAYPWGQRYDPFRANTPQRGLHDTAEVGFLPQGNTPEGFTDMGGHVFEWTSTPWPGKPGYAVVKGNGWDGRAGYGRGASRVARPVELRDVDLGFRCAADL